MSTTFRGLRACRCHVKWLPAFERELKAQGLIKESIDIAQLIGNAEASAGTHSQGGCLDIWQTDPRVSWVARKMGCIMWPRVTGSFANNRHSHGVLVGCPHLHPSAQRQILEAYQGGDGLLGDLPDHFDLTAAITRGLTWRDGLEWERRQRRRRVIKSLVPQLRANRARINTRLEKLLAERKAL